MIDGYPVSTDRICHCRDHTLHGEHVWFDAKGLWYWCSGLVKPWFTEETEGRPWWRLDLAIRRLYRWKR